MGRQKYFIKATLKGMKANYDNSQYHMGENVHPDPDFSDVVCSRGYHLARTVADALIYVPSAKEFYLATANKVLASDKTKIRTDRCTLLYRISPTLIEVYDKAKGQDSEVYKKTQAQAWEVYKKTKAQALEVYKKTEAQASEVYEKTKAQALEVCDKAKGQAWEVYEKTQAQASEVYDKTEAQAWEVYEKTQAQAHRQLVAKCLREMGNNK